ncbi:uncharacterized protein LY89DRAFT_782137 [Mollisia scopiformis]|uniref:Uncharacterized protein n=1 Tax=Mollisia scopiformis TaxID=149040 RepID=A0A194X9T2_MOLSC|nr:uncharacterized protein LY89DRAFT_782137 [Mollisia scopiformis]KUJ16889.1 hypothetical protein LY89DRAFT_782137 [Mollisia scopiformis]
MHLLPLCLPLITITLSDLAAGAPSNKISPKITADYLYDDVDVDISERSVGISPKITADYLYDDVDETIPS